MRQRLTNLDTITAALKPFLEQYLQEKGIDTSQNFLCINPKHKETSPSMTCQRYPENAFCFACGMTVDIFAAAHFLEGKPLKGAGFIEENVLYLAKKYGVVAELEDLTPEEIYEHRTYRAYDFAAQLISDPEFGDYSIIDPEITRRGWNKDKLIEWGIGTVNYGDFKDKMKKAGYEPSFLDGVDLNRSNLFDSHNLLFTVYDDFGRPVGFSAKNLKHKNGDNKSGPKYINTRGTGLECAIFKKGTRLYGFDIAKDQPQPLYIFEGQADVITARHHGMMNCCCTLGTALSDHHINLLKKHSVFSVVLVFDGDNAGELAVERALDTKFAKEKEFRVKLAQLPNGMDPDDLLREKGIDEFVRLKKWTAFEWRMMKFMDEGGEDITDEKRSEIAEKMAPIIVSEASHIKQEEMAKQVAKMTGFKLSTIMSEIKRLRNEKESHIQEKKRALIESVLSEVRYNPEDAEIALAEAQTAINDINKEAKNTSGSSVLDMVLSQKEHDESRTGEFAGFHMKPYGLGNIAARLDDDWRQDCLMYIGGSEQAGKTTFCSQMAYEIADDDRNDAICIYHSIDDASRFILYKWICNATEGLELTLNGVSNPNYWMNQEGFENTLKLREKGYKKIIQMIQDEKLILKDSSDGNSIAYIQRVAKETKEKYPNKKILLFLDNFHKYPDFAEMKGHERIKRLSNHLKNMTIQEHISLVSTVEYRKLQDGEKPSNLAIAESRSLAYDANVIMHLFNELHYVDEDQAELVHISPEGKILPRIWCKFGKNKVSGYEGREFIDLYPYNASYRSTDLQTSIQEIKDRQAFLRKND